MCFDFLKANRKSHIYCLQNVHWTAGDLVQIEREWGSDCFISCGSSNSRGVAILFSNNFDYEVEKIVKDNEGNYIVLSLKTYDCKLTLISLYGPNNDNPSFYQKLQDLVSDFDNTHCIIVGDWNLSLNQNLDTSNYLHENNPRSKKVVLEFLNNEKLIDVWRVLHPTENLLLGGNLIPLNRAA
ncbi:LINE-1 retrotransposable element ORF2 protein [Holothuria leucospilota]|uniref:LINE-1 retrotransposable element ORF2 protein n=1 Tax=Holothuria leucospilota TaxID=206669 RepID=A0A9Q1CDI9_HOLLE|nr:LINE-1 retrotransposable element ORF2 protein [Holothuria leucospilota]